LKKGKISIDEVMEAYNNGTLQEVFGTGTAATIAPIKELKYKRSDHAFQS
jgi:branched-chain amino acid aminotransferase